MSLVYRAWDMAAKEGIGSVFQTLNGEDQSIQENQW